MDDIRALIGRVSTIRDTIQDICDVQHDIARKAENLYCVLRRLQQEATRDNSPLKDIGDTRLDELKKYSDGCLRNLDEIDNFLTSCKAHHGLQTSILPARDKIPLSDTEREVLSKFREDFIYYALHISHLTVKASMESLGGAKDQIDKASYTLRYAVNTMTARLLAKNELSISTLGASPRGDFTLWEEVFYTLRQEGFSDPFLKEHKSCILAYIKAIERRSAFEHAIDPPIDNRGYGTAQWESAQEGRYRKSDYDSQSSNASKYYDDSEDTPGKPLSRKRTRSNEDLSRQTRRAGPTNGFPSQSSTKRDQNPGFRFSDPLKVFQTFKEKEGAKFADEEILANFLDEEPAQPPNVRDHVREIYQLFDDKYERRCESLLSRSSHGGKKDVKEYLGLIHELENQVLIKLDELHLSEDPRLRGIRKKIIDKVEKVLERLERAKARLES